MQSNSDSYRYVNSESSGLYGELVFPRRLYCFEVFFDLTRVIKTGAALRTRRGLLASPVLSASIEMLA